MAAPGTCRSAPQAASSRSVSQDARAESGVGSGPRPRADFLRNLLLMINHGDLFFDDGEKSESEIKPYQVPGIAYPRKARRKIIKHEKHLLYEGFRCRMQRAQPCHIHSSCWKSLAFCPVFSIRTKSNHFAS